MLWQHKQMINVAVYKQVTCGPNMCHIIVPRLYGCFMIILLFMRLFV